MKRCKNCGWENDDSSPQCEKCGASFFGAANEPAKQPAMADFDPRKTALGCPDCGYPLRNSDQRCPNCNSSVAGGGKKISTRIGGTVIQSAENEKQAVEGQKLAGFLVTYSHNPLGESYPVLAGRNYIGRDSNCDICIREDSLISGRHFSILYRSVDKKFKFKDEQSVNGTFINEKLTDEGEIKNFDLIRIGATKLLFIAIPQF